MTDNGISAGVLEAVVVGGDLSKLSPEQRVQYYLARCDAAGLDPRAQPFQYLKLQSGLTLYATKAATDQLAAARGLSVEIVSREMTDGEVYEVWCRVREGGRATDDMGAVFVGGLKGETLANARLRCITKAKRRTILAHCGLGALDETEAETIPGAQRVQVDGHGEVLGELPEPAPVEHDLAYWRRRAMALYTELGGEPSNQDACRADIAKDLGIPKESRTRLAAEQWQKWARVLERQRDAPEPFTAEAHAAGAHAVGGAAEEEKAAAEAETPPDPFGQARILAAAETGENYAQAAGL